MVKKFFALFAVVCIIQGTLPSCIKAQSENNFSINGLPVIHIDLVEAGSIITKEDKLKATMRIENAYGSDYSEQQLYNGLIEISGRGNTTWGMPKKPYSIDLITEEGEDNPSSLLGMPADEEWAIIANYSDKSLLRIPLAYYMGNAIGMEYSPRTRYTEVYLNDEYLGLYSLCEKIKKGDDRVNVKKLTDKPEDQIEPNITGGYIVEVTPKSRIEPDEKYVTSDLDISYVFKYPKKKNITDEQIAWFRQYMNKVESVLYGSNFKDPENGYRHYLDIDSFVDWYLINEFAKNPDAIFFASVFLYKNRNGKLKMGPLWDFDISFGNYDSNADLYAENGFWIQQSAWFNRLIQDKYFQQKISERFDELKPFFDSLPQKITSATEILKSTGAINRNFQKWPILGSYVWPNHSPFPGTYDGEIIRLTDWIKERTDWLNIYLFTSKAEQCLRLEHTRPHISIIDTDEFDVGDTTRIKTTGGYAYYFWNGESKSENIVSMHAGEKHWVQVEDKQGCKSLVSDTLYFIKKAKIIIDSSEFTYDGTPKQLYTSTIPEGLPVKVTYNESGTIPVTPGEYKVKAIINSAFYKDSISTFIHIKKLSQKINFPALPFITYLQENTMLNATASSGLPVQYIVSGNGVIEGNHLKPLRSGEVLIKAFQDGNQFYNASDTLSQIIWAEYENEFTKNLQAFPSPFYNTVTLVYPFADQTNLIIFNSRAKRLREYTLTGNKTSLNLSFLTKGAYLLYFRSSKGNGYITIVKQ